MRNSSFGDRNQKGESRPKIVPIGCEETKRIIADFTGKDASEEEVEKLRHHLAGCSPCTEAMARARLLRDEQTDNA